MPQRRSRSRRVARGVLHDRAPMPMLVPYTEAAESARRERLGGGDCMMCSLRDGLAGPRYLLEETEHATTLLCRYARRFGHVLVVLSAHVTALSDVGQDRWLAASAQAFRAATLVERALGAVRCYVGSFGSPRGDLPLSGPHVHLHVIPTYDVDDRPSRVLSSESGIYVAEEREWAALHARLAREARAWPARHAVVFDAPR